LVKQFNSAAGCFASHGYHIHVGRTGRRGPLDRSVEPVRGAPFLLAFSLCNTFRRKGRITQTPAALTFVGTLFLIAMSVQGSLETSVEVLLQSFHYDVLMLNL